MQNDSQLKNTGNVRYAGSNFHAPIFFFQRSSTDVALQKKFAPQCVWPVSGHPQPHPSEKSYGCLQGDCQQVGYGFQGQRYPSSNCGGADCDAPHPHHHPHPHPHPQPSPSQGHQCSLNKSLSQCNADNKGCKWNQQFGGGHCADQ